MPAKQGGANGADQNTPSQPPKEHNALAANEDQASTPQALPISKTPKRDYAQELAATIAEAHALHSRTEPVIVTDMRKRADLYEGAFVQAKQAQIDAATNDAPATARRARQDAVLHATDIEVVPAATLRMMAALDARQYRELRDPQRQAEAALVLAETARLDAGYRAALAEQAPQLSHVVQIVAAATDTVSKTTVSSARGAVPGAQPEQRQASASPMPPFTLEPLQLEQVAAKRARDFAQAAKQLNLNGIEMPTQPARAPDTAPSQGPNPAPPLDTPRQSARKPGPGLDTNRITADDVFTAAREERQPIVPVDVESKYLRVGNKFYHPKNTSVVAFVDKGNQLQTRSDSEQIAATLVAIARARGWDEVKVSGSEVFRKEVWLQASAHGMQVQGYTPTDIDKAELAKRSTRSTTNQVEQDDMARASERVARTEQSASPKPHKERPAQGAAPAQAPEREARPDKVTENTQRARAFMQQSPAEALQAHPELAGAYAAKALIEKKVVADGLSPQQSAVVMARVEARLINSIERGELPQVKMRDQVEVQREQIHRREVQR